MDEKKLENVQQIEDEQLDEVSGGKRLSRNTPLGKRRTGAKLPGLHPVTAPKVQSIYAAGEGAPVVVDGSDEDADQSIY